MESVTHNNRLYTFYLVVKLKSFSEAAKKLFVTQPAVSFQIRQLEEQYETKLIEIRNRQFVLTDVGSVLFEYAKRIVEDYRELDQAMSEVIEKKAKCVLLGASTTPGEYILPPIIVDFNKQNNDICAFFTINNTDHIIEILKDGEIDLAIIGKEIKMEGLVSHPFLSDNLLLIAASNSSVANSVMVNSKTLQQIPLITREKGSATRQVTFQILSQAGIQLNGLTKVLTLNSNEAIKRAVESGLGLAIISRWVVWREIELGILKSITISGIKFDRMFYFLYKEKNYKKKTIKKFIKFAKAYQFNPKFLSTKMEK